MRTKVKQRIVGAVVLVALAVIFIPFLFTLEPPRPLDTATLIPPSPDISEVTIEEPQRNGDIIPPGPVDQVFLPADSVATAQPGTPQPADRASSTAEGNVAQAKPSAQKPPASTSATPATAAVDDRPALADNTLQAWVIQVSSLRDKKAADELNSRLLAAGYKSYVRSADAQGGTTYRVFVGPVSLLSRANSDKTAIDASFGVQSMVLRFKP